MWARRPGTSQLPSPLAEQESGAVRGERRTNLAAPDLRGRGTTSPRTSQLPSPTPAEQESEAKRSGARRKRRADREAPRPPPPVFCCTRTRAGGRGLNPPTDERRPAVVEYDD